MQVVVHTSDVRGAGTDTDVLLEMHGSRCDSGALRLPSDRASFKRGAADMFHVLAPDCGDLQELHVWHTGKVRLPVAHPRQYALLRPAQTGHEM